MPPQRQQQIPQRIPSPYPQQEAKESLDQIARQLLVANIKTKEYQHHFDRLAKLSNSLIDECCTKMVEKSMSCESNEEKRIKVCLVLKQIYDKQLVSLPTIHQIIMRPLEVLGSGGSGEVDHFVPLFTKSIQICLMDLKQFAGMLLEEGHHFSLLLAVLKRLATSDQQQLSREFNASNIDLLVMMPESSRSKSGLLEALSEAELQFLEPFLGMEAGMTSELKANPNPTILYRWLRDNVAAELHTERRFVHVLLRCCLVHVTESTTLAEGVDRDVKPSKSVEGDEKKLFHQLKPLMQKFLHDDSSLQMTALYTVQNFCHEQKFPKGLIWRLFNYFYHEDVIDEEIFLKWKEDVNDEYSGKDKALTQVNSWLTWLQEADTEEDDEDDDEET